MRNLHFLDHIYEFRISTTYIPGANLLLSQVFLKKSCWIFIPFFEITSESCSTDRALPKRHTKRRKWWKIHHKKIFVWNLIFSVVMKNKPFFVNILGRHGGVIYVRKSRKNTFPGLIRHWSRFSELDLAWKLRVIFWNCRKVKV